MGNVVLGTQAQEVKVSITSSQAETKLMEDLVRIKICK
jgi:hypothetical protein